MLRGNFVPRPGSWPVEAGTAELIADPDRPGAYLLAVDGVAQSYVDLLEPTWVEFGYVRLLAALSDLAAEPPPAPLGAVHVGGGGATLARYLAARRPGSPQVVFEYDGRLADGVRERLGVDGFRLEVGDGRALLAGQPVGSADLVVTDAFVGDRVPAHLTTAEFAADARRVLRPGGYYAVNVADKQPLDYARRVTAGLAATFAEVAVLADPAVLRGRRFGNLVLVGSDQPLPLAELTRRIAGDAAAPARLVGGRELRSWVATSAAPTDVDPLDSPAPPEGAFTLG